MLDVFNFPTPQQSNYQEFYGGKSGVTSFSWNKPRGASMVRFMLIGAGGGGAVGTGTSGGGGGGSGAVTSWIGPAIFIPDSLSVRVGLGGAADTAGTDSFISYYGGKSNTTILTANGGTGGSGTTGGAGGIAFANNFFGASGIFTSTVGQDGASGGTTGGGGVINPALTFLSGGAGGSGSAVDAGLVIPNYGYPTLAAVAGNTKGRDGYFITQPILLGCGGAGGGTTTSAGGAGGRGGIGCGGGGAGEDSLTGGGRGGDGAVFIWAW